MPYRTRYIIRLIIQLCTRAYLWYIASGSECVCMCVWVLVSDHQLVMAGLMNILRTQVAAAECYSPRGFFLALVYAAVHLCDRWTPAALWTSTKKRVRSLMGPRGWSSAGSRRTTALPGWWCCSRPTSPPPTRWSSGWRCTGRVVVLDSWCCRTPCCRSPDQIRSDKIMRRRIKTL